MPKKFFLLVLILLLAPLSYVFAQSTCGNSLCEPGENSCTCSKDCGLCAPTDIDVCVSYTCTKDNICKRTAVPLCCGNDTCEQNESYGNCERDCKPTSVEIQILKPLDKNFLRGEQIIINAKVTAHGKPTLAATASARGFFGNLELFNDGKHSDGNSFDSVYGNAFIVKKDLDVGIYKVFVDANFLGTKNSIDFNFNLTALLDAEMQLFEKYFLGEEIDIRGRVTAKGNGVKIPLNAKISVAQQELFSQQIETSAAGNFSLPYHTSLIDPTGLWVIEVSGTDDNNNTLSATKQILLEKPPKERFLGIELFKDINQASKSGGIIEWFVRVKDRDRLVTGAKVVLVDGQNNSFEFQELSEGKYSLSYRIPYQLGTGDKNFTIVAEKKIADAKIAGTRVFKTKIEKSNLLVNFLKPVEKSVEAGKSLEIRVFVSYPDEIPVSAAGVFAVVGGEKIRMAPEKEGIFSVGYVPPESFVGIQSIEVRADDMFGNAGSDQTAIEVSSPGLSSVIQKNFLTILGVIIVIAIILFFSKETLFASRKVFFLEARKKQLLKLEQELQEKYFKQQAIPRVEYKKQLDEYENELQEIEAKLKGDKK